GSRTRTLGGGQTPLHDGSRTPVHGAWDPTASNTPARTELDDYTLDEGSPSPSYQPATPGYQAPETPQGPYTPQTPGNVWVRPQLLTLADGIPAISEPHRVRHHA
ncbi:hypothetical protein MTO96_045837, partial [Rhipicephalus appendiculatus]